MFDKVDADSITFQSLNERQALANLNVLLEESYTWDLINVIDLESLLTQSTNPTSTCKASSKMKKKIWPLSFPEF